MPPHRILLVEDGLVNQKVLTGLLTGQGYHVTVAHNGQDAVDCFLADEFDVVLMDVEMPIMDGLTATRCIRELEMDGRSRIPIIAVTSSADSSACLEAGMDAFLEKPVPVAVLQETLQWALNG